MTEFQSQDSESSNALSFQLENHPPHQCDFLEPYDEVEIKERNLPHWNKKGAYYYVTFRLADSIPKEKAEQIKSERAQWLKNHEKTLSKEDVKEYYRIFSERLETLLNAGFGSCYLADRENSRIVASALLYFNNDRYYLDEWVVMPNHVHVILKPLGEHSLTSILHSWKSFTAKKINERIKKTGQLWMHESYDHIIRTETSLNRIREYIINNPIKANIVVSHSSNKVAQASRLKGKKTQAGRLHYI